jgi:hypothetical protein
MPDERQEIQLKRPASHTMLSTFYSYTTAIVGTQGFVNEFDSLLVGSALAWATTASECQVSELGFKELAATRILMW